jgi:hypothetical protein
MRRSRSAAWRCSRSLTWAQGARGELGIDAELHTSLIVDQAAAEEARFAGSPTVRVDGRDVEPGSEPVTEYVLGCRLYRLQHRYAGLPDEHWVREALQAVLIGTAPPHCRPGRSAGSPVGSSPDASQLDEGRIPQPVQINLERRQQRPGRAPVALGQPD